MAENAQDSVYERDNLERTIEEAFSPLWELGVIGVKLTLSNHIVKIKVYLLSDVHIEGLANALDTVKSRFDSSFSVEEQVVHGIVPAQKVVTNVFA